MDNDKKKAAAVSAVLQYIKSEQEAVAAMQAAGIQAPVKRAGISGQWGLSGRQSLMQMRNLMQVKTFHGTGLR